MERASQIHSTLWRLSRMMYTSIAFKDFLSPIVTIVAAAGAALGVILTLRANRRNQLRRQAFDAYEGYLKDCLAEPMLASGDVTFPKSPNSTWSKQFYKYQWMVARFLGAAEEILEASSQADWSGEGLEPGWYDAILGDARWHADYFSSEFFKREEFQMCSRSIQEIILEAVPPDARKRLESWKRK
jgi:hypothetical protein